MTGNRSKTLRIIEIAELLGVTHQRASKIADQAGFPAPVGREGQSRLWDRREVVAWAREWRREKPWRKPIMNPTRKATTSAHGRTQSSVIRIFPWPNPTIRREKPWR